MTLYEVLKEIVPVEKFCLNANLYTEDAKRKIEDKDEQETYDLMKKICNYSVAHIVLQ